MATLSEISQKDKGHTISPTCGIYPMTQMNLSANRHREWSPGCQRGWGGPGAERECGKKRCGLLCTGRISGRVLLHSTGKHIHHPANKP